ncbi:MAG: Veg family protein [Lachnospiraceae bacterium]|nr:Veg family protein [Lachnospiraceae bacterium]
MEKRQDINRIRNTIQRNVGRRVKIRENKGRNKIDIAEGIISGSYPCVFSIQVEDSDIPKTLSYSYTDLLIHEVEVTFLTPAVSTPKS